jgi:hypothetical protein
MRFVLIFWALFFISAQSALAKRKAYCNLSASEYEYLNIKTDPRPDAAADSGGKNIKTLIKADHDWLWSLSPPRTVEVPVERCVNVKKNAPERPNLVALRKAKVKLSCYCSGKPGEGPASPIPDKQLAPDIVATPPTG